MAQRLALGWCGKDDRFMFPLQWTPAIAVTTLTSNMLPMVAALGIVPPCGGWGITAGVTLSFTSIVTIMHAFAE